MATGEYPNQQAAHQRALAHYYFFHLGKSLANEGAIIGNGSGLHRTK
jgi:hypothetical protein